MSSEIRIAFHTLGCRLNQYDTELMKAALPAGLDLRVVPWGETADVFVLNSCTVTLKADQKCRQLVRNARKRCPGARIVVTGCYAQTQPDALAALPELDGVFGVDAAAGITEWLPGLLEDGERRVDVHQHVRGETFLDGEIEDFAGHTRAFVKVQDGCDLRCAYCLIREARGPGRSRDPQSILDQIDRLAGQGFRELVLAGVHLGSYGRDLSDGPDLRGMLDHVLVARPELRFRLSSIHPNEVDAPLLDLFARHANLRPYLHISLQSASDGVLKRMRRPYRADSARRAIARAAALDPAFGIGADVIVGFPGETDDEFFETRDAITGSALAYLHVFRYSPRPGTPAADMPQVHPETVTARSRLLRSLSREKRRDFEQGLVGATREAIVEDDSGAPGWRNATTDNYATVRVPDSWETGRMVHVTPAGFRDGVLYAEEVRAIPDGTEERA